VKSPHLLLAASNSHRLRQNLVGILDAQTLKLIDDEISKNASGIFKLGESHFDFARTLAKQYWRQKISRFYYAAYNVTRSLRFLYEGHYSQDVTDHKKVEVMPKDFPTTATYENRLSLLRDDRNLCDYDHTCTEADLIISVKDADVLVAQLIADARAYFRRRGVTV